MSISFGYIIGHICEFLIFVYFANTSFYPRRNYILSNVVSLVGYAILFVIGSFGKVPVSIVSFFIINVILLTYCYNVKLKSSVFYSLILDVLSCIGEYIFLYFMGVRYSPSWMVMITGVHFFVAVLCSKLVYLIGIVFLKQFITKKFIHDSDTPTILSVIPILSMICLTVMMSMEMDNLLFLCFSTVFLVINFITFYINAGIDKKNKELQALHKEMSEYLILSEKYENTKMMRHDFHKQISVLKDLIGEDNAQAKEYMQQIQFAQRELDYAQYTDNKILNVLLAQKVKECHANGVEIHIHSESPTLSFISDIDVVAIFSNMIDNAIEACGQSENKEIYVDLYTVNDSYSVVKIENSADKEPIILDGELCTQKENKNIHGIGIKSINNALKKYNSELTWNYDRAEKFFKAAAVIHIPKIKKDFREKACEI